MASITAVAGSAIFISFRTQLIPVFTGRILSGFSYGVAFVTISMSNNGNSNLMQISIFTGIFLSFILRKSPLRHNIDFIGLFCVLLSALLAVVNKINSKHEEILLTTLKHDKLDDGNFKRLIQMRLIFVAQFILPLNVILMWIASKETAESLNIQFFDNQNFNSMVSLIYVTRLLAVLITSSTVNWNRRANDQIHSGLTSLLLLFCVFIFSSGIVSTVEKILLVEIFYQLLNIKIFFQSLKFIQLREYFVILSEIFFHVLFLAIALKRDSWYETIFVAWMFTIATVVVETIRVVSMFRGWDLPEINIDIVLPNVILKIGESEPNDNIVWSVSKVSLDVSNV